LTPAKYNFAESNKSGNNHPQSLLRHRNPTTSINQKMNNWLRSKENRKFLSWLGGGLVMIILGMWAASTFIGTNNILNWLLNEENRKLITWLGSVLGVIVTGLWVAYTYFYKPSQTSIPSPTPISTGDIHSNGTMNNIEKTKTEDSRTTETIT
jgi:hypothetical protein